MNVREFDGIKVFIRRSNRARNLRLVIKPLGVELVIPKFCTESQAMSFFHRHRNWAELKMAEVHGRTSRQVCSDKHFFTSGSIPFQGCETPLIIKRATDRYPRVDRENGGAFEISLSVSNTASPEEQIRAALFGWIRTWMTREANRLAFLHGEADGLVPRQIRIKQMATRWGSCGSHNDINLNWLLAFTPPSVLEYVVVHEICHIIHRNHSRDYWALVAHYLPDWNRERKWLKQNGTELLIRSSI